MAPCLNAVGGLLAILIASTAQFGVLSHRGDLQNESIGKIKSFDEMLMMYGKEITEGRNLKPALEEARRLAREPGVVKEYADYYLEILELLEETKNPQMVSHERDRLNGIITSASYQSDGKAEVDYAVLRRNILESFVDSSAGYLVELIKLSPQDAMSRLADIVNSDKDKDDDDGDDDDGGEKFKVVDDL